MVTLTFVNGYYQKEIKMSDVIMKLESVEELSKYLKKSLHKKSRLQLSVSHVMWEEPQNLLTAEMAVNLIEKGLTVYVVTNNGTEMVAKNRRTKKIIIRTYIE